MSQPRAQQPLPTSSAQAPPVSITQTVLDTAAGALQSHAPIRQHGAYLCAFHSYAADPARPKILAHHYCSHVNKEMHQCVIYDSNDKNAKLIGVEFSQPTVHSTPQPPLPSPRQRQQEEAGAAGRGRSWNLNKHALMSVSLFRCSACQILDQRASVQYVADGGACLLAFASFRSGRQWHTWRARTKQQPQAKGDQTPRAVHPVD